MKKNDLIKTEDGIYRILSIEANRVLAIDCLKKTMPKFYSVSSFGNGENIDCIPVDFLDMAILDYAIGFISDSKYKDCAEQAAEFVGLIEFDDDYEEE